MLALLKELYGERVDKVKAEQRAFDVPNKSSASINVTTVSSQFHIEMSPSECGYVSLLVLRIYLLSMTEWSCKKSSKRLPNPALWKHQFRPNLSRVSIQVVRLKLLVVVLNAVDELTQAAQAGLRRTMEKYMSTCRLILCCNSLSKVCPQERSN